MNNMNFNIEDMPIEQWDDEEIKRFENVGEHYVGDLEDKKKDIKGLIAIENLRIIEEKANMELGEEEFIELKFHGAPTGVSFLGAMWFSANYYVMPMALMDIGNRFIVFGTRKKLLIYEVRELNKLQREYVIDYKDIFMYYYKQKKDYIVLCFKAKKDKYDELRECSSWLLYKYFQGRINMIVNTHDRELIVNFFEQKINLSKKE
jgi:hypothetical protein